MQAAKKSQLYDVKVTGQGYEKQELLNSIQFGLLKCQSKQINKSYYKIIH